MEQNSIDELLASLDDLSWEELQERYKEIMSVPLPEDPTRYGPDSRYLGKPNIKRAGTKTKWTPELWAERERCKNDILYFALRYVKIITLDHGKQHIKPFKFQLKAWKAFIENRFNIVLAPRQSGKSISYVVYVLHTAIFNPDFNIAILANKASTARQILGRVYLSLENLPFFLQPGCVEFNKGNCKFDTDTKIFASSSSADSVRGDSVNVVLLDEFAFVENDEEFMTSTYPVITAGTETKIIIVSTPKGIGNQFEIIWKKAMGGSSEYVPLRVFWWDVPGRDEEWKRKTIENTSLTQFRQEFGCEFIGSSDTLLSAEALNWLNDHAENPKWMKENDSLYVFESPLPDHNYIMTIDVCKGRGKDRSTFSIIDVTEFPYQVVACYQNDLISPLLYPAVIYKYARLYNDALVICENNDHGIIVCNALYYELEYENFFTQSAVLEKGIGVFVDKKVKSIGTSNCKDLVEENKIVIKDRRMINEFMTFCAKGSSYEAQQGKYDDMVQNIWLFAWFMQTKYFHEFAQEGTLSEQFFQEKMDAIAADLPPFGIIDDGTDEYIINQQDESFGGWWSSKSNYNTFR